MTLLEAIAHEEGWYISGSRSRRNKNPGNLIWGPEAKGFGATHGDPKFGVFPTEVRGWEALHRWLSVPAKFHQGPLPGFFLDPNGTTLVGGYLGATLAQMIHRFAPSADGNNTAAYIAGVLDNTRWRRFTSATIVTSKILETPEVAPRGN